jgi:polysaccharide biosynthesis protein PslH
MRILFLCQLVPYPPDSGPKIRAYYTLRYLSKFHNITLLAFSRPEDTQDAIEHLGQFCDQVHTIPLARGLWRNIQSLVKSIIKRKPFVIERDTLSEMSDHVKQLLLKDEFDAIHSDQLWMAQYVPTASHDKIKKVLDEHNACYQVFQRLASHERNVFKRFILEREWRSLKNYEAKAITLFDTIVTVTFQDQSTINELLTSGADGDQKPAFLTIPICVDTTNDLPVENIRSTMNILYLGTMFWLPNVEGVLWFAKNVFPIIKAKVPRVTFTIVGKNPPAEILALQQTVWKKGERDGTHNISTKPKHSKERSVKSGSRKSDIVVTGYAADPLPYLQNAAAFIIPLLSGSGMRVKILDAWKWGIPVISTTIGAEGIDYLDGENILIADEPEDFAAAVSLILQDPDMARFLRLSGRQWVEEKYNWQRIYRQWLSIYPIEEKPSAISSESN